MLQFDLPLIQASTKHVSENIAKQIHEKAAPVVAWLRTAEEESEEEEEEDEVEVVYSESAGTKGITTVTEKPAQRAEEVTCVYVHVCMCEMWFQ
jgi:arginase family enzyme